jgi:CheY-like chemotaxis protein
VVNSRPLQSAASAKILIVDDDELTRAVTRAALEEHGFVVVELASSLGMNTLIASEKPDLILIDVSMPALEGDKAVAIVRRHGLHRGPILLYSALPLQELAALARSSGANGFVSKAAGANALVQGVRAFLGWR